MCRLRIPNGISHAHQLRGIADIAERHGGGYADVTTRANLQIREIGAASAHRRADGAAGSGPHLARRRRRQYPQHHRQPDRGHRSAGADRHAAARARAASLHPQSSRALRPAAQVQHRLRRRRPGRACSRTPTTSASPRCASRTAPAFRRASISACCWAASPATAISRATPACCSRPEQCVPVAVAVVRVFIAEGDRTDRKRARLKYVLDALGHREIHGRGREGAAVRAAAPAARGLRAARADR